MRRYMSDKKKYIGIMLICFILSSMLYNINYSVYAGVAFSLHSTTDFNIKSDDGIKTTYSDNGYSTVLKVGSTEGNVVSGSGTVSGVTCTTTGTSISNGNYIKVNYHLENTTSSDVTISLASHADTQIGTNDSAPITALDGGRGFTMTDGTNVFTFIGKDSYGVTNIDTYWFGKYSERTSNLWNQIDSTGITGIDSGMAYSWQNRTIAANSSIDLSVLFGVGDLNEPPTLTATNTLKDKYFVNEEVELIGQINDVDTGDVVTIKYAVDGGTEYSVDGSYTPNGTPVNYSAVFTIPSDITEGNHTIQIWACDDNGNMSVPVSKTFYVELDKEAPIGTHTINPEEQTNSDVVISVTATDSYSGVKQITLPDGTVVKSDNVTYTATQNGDYTFILQDNANNTREYTVTISNIDKVVPDGTATVTQPTETKRSATINFTATDVGFGVDKIIKPDGTEASGTATTYDVTEPGTYTFKVIDVVGNEKSVDVNVTIVSDGVLVKYIDQVTKEEIGTEEKISGNVGSTYTSTSKTIDGYELVLTPSNATGTLTMDKITVTYEYRKNSNVITRYIDENYSTVLETEVTKKYKEGDTYTTEEKTIDGYKLTGKTDNTSGTVGREDIIVIYKYKKISEGVDVKYIDQVTKNEIAVLTHIDGVESEEYTTKSKEVDGYELVLTPDNANGNMTVDKITVTYEYRKNSNVIVKYIDENSNTIIEDDFVTEYKEGDPYTTEEKIIDGYKLTGKTDNTSGTVVRDDITVIYKYKKISEGVDVRYIDQVTKNEIAGFTYFDGLENDIYTTTPEEIEGYELVLTPDNANGNMTVDKITVTYEYRKNSNVTVKYIDENSNTNIVNDVVTEYKEGDPYTTEEKIIDGYKLTGKTDNTSGTVARDDITVIYKYKKISEGVDVRYIDQVTKEEILISAHKEGLENDPYTTLPEEIEGYELVLTPDNANGNMTVDKITVVYEYRKTSNVIVKFVDENYSTEISPQDVKSYKEGDEYTTSEKNIDGYELTGKTTNTSGVMGREDIIVIYKYKKISAGVDVKYIDQVTREEIADKITKTGLEKDPYTSYAKTIDGYELVLTPDNANGEMAVDKITVTYEYRKNSYVIAKYIDENSGRILHAMSQSKYKEGDTYTTVQEEISDYTFTRVEGQPTGIVGNADIEIIYYYKKNTSVTSKYIDMVTKDIISSEEKIYGLEGQDYETIQKEIDGYILVDIQGIANGKMSYDPTEVTYQYKKLSNLITEHIDANTNQKIVDDVVKAYKEGDTYEVLPQNLDGYVVVEEPEQKVGTMGRENITKTFYYKKISDGLVVKYVDKITGEILAQKEYAGNVNDKITLEEKTFLGYVLEERPQSATVILGVEAKEEIYYYRKSIQLNVVGIDQETGEELYNSKVSGIEGDTYITVGRNVNDYVLVREPDNSTGIFDRNDTKVTYEYRKVAGEVLVKYIDKETNEELYSYKINGLSGDNYNTQRKEFEDYTLVKIVGDEVGVLTSQSKEVTYYYEKNPKSGTVVVIYEDENGNQVLTERLSGIIGENYSINIREIDGYDVIEVPDNINGKYEKGIKEIVVKIIETKVKPTEKGIVEIIYEDEYGEEIIKEEMSGGIGADYEVSVREISGYEVIEIPENVIGKYTEEKIEVIIKIKQSEEKPTVENGNVVIIYEDKNGNEILKQELTGKIGTEYKVNIKNISGYNVVKIPENINGKYTEETVYVKIVLEKVQEVPIDTGRIIIKYIDSEGNIIKEDYVENGEIGKKFYYELPEIDGYRIVGNKTIETKFEDSEIVIEVKYERVEAQENNIESNENVNTGDINIVVYIIVFMICTSTLIVKFKLNKD